MITILKKNAFFVNLKKKITGGFFNFFLLKNQKVATHRFYIITIAFKFNKIIKIEFYKILRNIDF